ncbi:MAG: acetaldehyde dehydrogenase (acetylating) [Clostridia bacterium]|uniref:acetaldehyde dehydrogenase (acetylating) n=1 Tax=Desulfitibacter alkalitolerans TaxID=264641 RepID=UPI0006866A29|nr:acetaldehyde dehydrogenase (acetylating) [Desulfitibacter alkalitolerans]MBS3969206.1 acetaldehyde dehydrogenase (acetylating) [Clostridia bacterium]
MAIDYDLRIIQEARDLARKAKEAQEVLAAFSEEKINKILASISEAAIENASWLAKMAVDETKYGVVEHKVIKNLFAGKDVYEYIKGLKTTGIIKEDPVNKVVEVAVPVGVILGIIPTTNPTSTLIHNSLCAIKAGNAIVFSPHPAAIKCSCAAAQVVNEAAVKAGAPDGIVSCMSRVSMQAVNELMHHEAIALIVATGGSAMVKAAYSAGKPALGVGPGNVPAFVERTANIQQAVKDIITSKTFDNGMICASEQAIIIDEPIKDQVINELKKQGCYFLNRDEVDKVSRLIMTPKGGMNPAFVGKSPDFIAAKAGIEVPAGTKILIAPLEGYGPEYPLSYEKLTTVLGLYVVKDWHEGCLLSIELLKLGGIGHSFVIHSQNDEVIREFIQKPVFRILVNTPSALGGIGYSTGLAPSMTLGCGTWGGSSLSDNLTPLHLINIKKLAYGTVNVDFEKSQASTCSTKTYSPDQISEIVKQVLARLESEKHA